MDIFCLVAGLATHPCTRAVGSQAFCDLRSQRTGSPACCFEASLAGHQTGKRPVHGICVQRKQKFTVETVAIGFCGGVAEIAHAFKLVFWTPMATSAHVALQRLLFLFFFRPKKALEPPSGRLSEASFWWLDPSEWARVPTQQDNMFNAPREKGHECVMYESISAVDVQKDSKRKFKCTNSGTEAPILRST